MKSAFLLASILVLAAFATSAAAQKERFAGTFVTTDPNTGGITRITFDADDTINVWGRCHPSDCDWGKQVAFAYGPNVGSDLQASANSVSAIYVKGFATTILIIKPIGENKIRVDTFTRFTDCSKRTAYSAREVLQREGSVP